MIRINLLPVRQIRKKQRLLQEVAGFGVLLIALAAGLTLFGLSLGHQIDALQQQIKTLNDKKASYAKIETEMRQLQKDRELIEKKIAAIRDLKKSGQIGVRVLDELANITPPGQLWLESLKDTPGMLSIQGVALDNATIAQFMDKLSASPFFGDAELAGTSLKEIAGNQLKAFSLDVKVVQPEEKAQPAG
ncbi:MAG: PilN domain-containing protein [Desulfobacteraceae bacterium]|nr:PilN domain-containing protein [Desulfobacteraceae bacterium]